MRHIEIISTIKEGVLCIAGRNAVWSNDQFNIPCQLYLMDFLWPSPHSVHNPSQVNTSTSCRMYSIAKCRLYSMTVSQHNHLASISFRAHYPAAPENLWHLIRLYVTVLSHQSGHRLRTRRLVSYIFCRGNENVNDEQVVFARKNVRRSVFTFFSRRQSVCIYDWCLHRLYRLALAPRSLALAVNRQREDIDNLYIPLDPARLF